MIRFRSSSWLKFTAWSALALGCSERGGFFDDIPIGSAGSGGASGMAGSGPSRGGEAGRTGPAAGNAGVSSSGGSVSGSAGTGAATGSGGRAGSSSGGVAGTERGDAGDAPGGFGAEDGGAAGQSAAGAGGVAEAGAGGEPSAGEGGSDPEPCDPSPELCDGISNDCNAAIDEDACPDGCAAQRHDGHLYLLCLIAEEASWVNYVTAAAGCGDAGVALGLGFSLELARIESAPENAFVKDWIAGAANQWQSQHPVAAERMVWFGANDLDEEHRWAFGRGESATQFFSGSAQGGGTPYQSRFHDFADGRPNSSGGTDEDCGAFDSEFAWQWNDLACGEGRLGFVCEQTP